jgi:hypothetical protein
MVSSKQKNFANYSKPALNFRMPFMKNLIFCISLFSNTVFGEFKLEDLEIDLEWFDSASFRAPYRMDDLDGAMIAELSLRPDPTPILFPALISPFEWIDNGVNDFISLNELCENPSLGQPIEQYRPSSHSPFNVKGDIWNESLKKSNTIASKSGQLDITRFIDSKNQSLPDDQQLHSYLNQDKIELSAEEKQKILEKLFAGEGKEDFIAKLLQPDFAGESTNDSNPNLASSIQQSDPPKLTVPRIEIPEAPEFPPTQASGEPILGGKANLSLKASKATANGRQLPAQASDFYITTKTIHELFKDLDVEKMLEGEVESVAELWAKAEKSTNPEVIFGVKSILLEAKVGKARTDAFGQAALRGIQPSDKYYLIGIEKDDLSNQVTIWSKELKVNPGENMVELSSNDVIYQE